MGYIQDGPLGPFGPTGIAPGGLQGGQKWPKNAIKRPFMAISGSGVLITDGSDGFGDLKIISSKEDRPYSDHGITMDFSLISVCVEHQVRGRR